jgi:hypothetical protein
MPSRDVRKDQPCLDDECKPVPEDFQFIMVSVGGFKPVLEEIWEDCTYCVDGTEPGGDYTFTKMCRLCGGTQKVRKSP